jgi:hypothetical protein
VISGESTFTAQGPYLAVDYDMNAPTTHSWNLSLQRQVTSDWFATASYLGSHTIHLWTQQALNPAIWIPGQSTRANIQQRRRFSLERPADGLFYGNVDRFDAGGTASYHGLLISVRRRPMSGVTVNANYTWSHCIGDPDTGSGLPSAGNSYVDPNDRSSDRGNCDADRRHNLNLTSVVETPTFVNPTLNALATGWRLSGLYRFTTGEYLTVTTGVDRALNGLNAGRQRADQILDNPYGDRNSLTNYLNRNAFALPALGSLGNMDRANVLGPSRWQFDVALSRIFQLSEAQRLEFRAEAFNVTNSLRRGNPTTNLSSNLFGQINSSEDPRIMQFALKYSF